MKALVGSSLAMMDSSFMRVTGTEIVAASNMITTGTMTTIGTRIAFTTTTTRIAQP